jgi:hypothetical protein
LPRSRPPLASMASYWKVLVAIAVTPC